MSVQATLSGDPVEPIQKDEETDDELQPEDLPKDVQDEVYFRDKEVRQLYSADCNECGWTHYKIVLQPLNMTLGMEKVTRNHHYLDEEGNTSEVEIIEDTASHFYHVRPDEADSHLICRDCAHHKQRQGEHFDTHLPGGNKNRVLVCGKYVDTERYAMPDESYVNDWDIPNEVVRDRDTIIAEEDIDDTCMVEVTNWSDWFKDMVVSREIQAAVDTTIMTFYDSMWVNEESHDELQTLYEKMKPRFECSRSTALS